MISRRWIQPLFLLALGLPSAGPLPAAEWQLTFAVTEDRTIESPDGKAPPRQESTHYTQTVALGSDYLVVQDDRAKAIHDFSGRRLLALDPAAATYHDLSLYHLPSFLEYELMNRNAIGAAMRAGKVDRLSATFTRFDNETALRVESRRAPPDSPAPVIATVPQGDTLEFRHQDAVVVRFTPALSRPPDDERCQPDRAGAGPPPARFLLSAAAGASPCPGNFRFGPTD